MSTGAGFVWYLSRCDHEPNTTRSSSSGKTKFSSTRDLLTKDFSAIMCIRREWKLCQYSDGYWRWTRWQAFVLSVPHTMISMCFIPDNPSREGNVIFINQAAIFAEIRDTEITRYDCYGVWKVGVSAAAGPNWNNVCNGHALPDNGTNRP